MLSGAESFLEHAKSYDHVIGDVSDAGVKNHLRHRVDSYVSIERFDRMEFLVQK